MTVILGKNSKTTVVLNEKEVGSGALSVSEMFTWQIFSELGGIFEEKKMAWVHVDECFATD